jgi:cell division protein ZapA
MSRPFEIEIYGQRYTIRGDGEESYVQELAQRVDAHMRTLAKKMKTVTPTQLAVLTALNLANELDQALKQQKDTYEDMNRRATGLIESIQDTLGGAH